MSAPAAATEVAVDAVVAEVLPPQHPSLPRWPTEPPAVDETGTSHLVLAVGGGEDAAVVARAWVTAAAAHAPTTLGVLDDVEHPDDRATLASLLDRARTGVRVLVVGGQHDVMQVLAVLRARGAHESEIRAHVTHDDDLPVFCGHCQTVFRAVVAPGGEADCAGCGRVLEVHAHAAATLGAFLASDARAGAS